MQIEERLGVEFRNRALLELALVHGSRVNETQDAQTASNERLEFLGDAVLGMVVAETLYHELPDAGEGTLTATRSALVRRETLADVARGLGLGAFLQLGRGEAASGGRDKDRNLADTLEAVVAAVYLDQGYDAARAFVLRHLQSKLQEAHTRGTVPNYKAMLQEHLQAKNQPLPRYRVVSAIGPDHEREFTAEALLHDTILGRGTGRSRKAAETDAACAALEQLHTKEESNHGQA
jgi:ribonuclease-3